MLVKACLSGDRNAFAMLVDKYEKKLFNAAYRVVDDYEDAMDATQTAFVKAYEKLHTFDPRYRFFSWVYRILLNESINILNKRKRFDRIDGDFPTRSRNPEELFGDSEKSRYLQEALMALGEDHRIVVVLRHFQGMSYREMGEVIGIPEKTVKSRLFAARRQLKQVLERRGIFR